VADRVVAAVAAPLVAGGVVGAVLGVADRVVATAATDVRGTVVRTVPSVTDRVVRAATTHVRHTVVRTVPSVTNRVIGAATTQVRLRVIRTMPSMTNRVVRSTPHMTRRVVRTMLGDDETVVVLGVDDAVLGDDSVRDARDERRGGATGEHAGRRGTDGQDANSAGLGRGHCVISSGWCRSAAA
jgi:hypothetical protein